MLPSASLHFSPLASPLSLQPDLTSPRFAFLQECYTNYRFASLQDSKTITAEHQTQHPCSVCFLYCVYPFLIFFFFFFCLFVSLPWTFVELGYCGATIVAGLVVATVALSPVQAAGTGASDLDSKERQQPMTWLRSQMCLWRLRWLIRSDPVCSLVHPWCAVSVTCGV